jgi:hypothetical protein
MLIELFIFFEVVALILFAAAFFTKQEILWALCVVILGVLMFTSFNVETYVYQYNTTLLAYEPVQVSNSYPYLMGLNAAFFVLALVLGIFDLYDKISTASSDKGGGKRDER